MLQMICSVGGKYLARMEAKDGSFGFDFEVVYDQIVVAERFSYTMPDGREVEVTFNDAGGKTEVSVSFDAETENPVEMQQGRAGRQYLIISRSILRGIDICLVVSHVFGKP
jgi:hypothetical protein